MVTSDKRTLPAVGRRKNLKDSSTGPSYRCTLSSKRDDLAALQWKQQAHNIEAELGKLRTDQAPSSPLQVLVDEHRSRNRAASCSSISHRSGIIQSGFSRAPSSAVQNHRQHCSLFPWGAGCGNPRPYGLLAFAR